jgi:beta-galactosidase
MNLAHGSHGQLYFEWRRPLAGNEQFRPSFIKRFDGSINPAKPVFAQISKEFAHLGPLLAGATTHADIALLYDFTNEWAQGFWSVGDKNDRYDSAAGRYYNGFKVLQRNIDIVPFAAGFSPYKLIVAPNLRLTDDSLVQRLKAFVSNGGILVLNNRAGTQNLDNSVKRMLSPGLFAEIAGVTAEAKLDLTEYNAANGTLDPALDAQVGIIFPGSETAFRPRTILESLTLHGAEPVAVFRGGRMAGRPAIARNRVGQGWVFYVATDCAENAFHEALARTVGTAANLSPLIAAPYGVEVTSREDSQAIYYFLLNLTEIPCESIPLPRRMDNLVTGETAVTRVSLGPLEVAVLESRKEAALGRSVIS